MHLQMGFSIRVFSDIVRSINNKIREKSRALKWSFTSLNAHMKTTRQRVFIKLSLHNSLKINCLIKQPLKQLSKIDLLTYFDLTQLNNIQISNTKIENNLTHTNNYKRDQYNEFIMRSILSIICVYIYVSVLLIYCQ